MRKQLVEIDIFATVGCASRETLRANLAWAAAGAGVELRVRDHLLDEDLARERMIPGSPTVLVNGRDISSGGQPGTG